MTQKNRETNDVGALGPVNIAALTNIGRAAVLIAFRHGEVSSKSLSDHTKISRQAVQLHLRGLVKQGVLRVEGGGKNTLYVLADPISAVRLLPNTTVEDRAMNQVALEWYRRKVQSDEWQAKVQNAGCDSSKRPFYYFDVRNVIHPCFVADANFVITACSLPFEELFRKPRLKEETFPDFFRKFDMIAWHLDTEHDEPAEEGHFINSVVLPALAKTQTDNIPQVNKRLVRFSHPERGDIFLEFSCAAQRGHAGLQSMMPLAEQRIRMLRENSAQNSRWIAMNHRLRGSINVLNGPVQNLDHYLQKWGFEQLMSSFSDALQQIRSGDQVPPEAVYENMATIENELARNLETLRTTLYGNVAGLQRGIGRFNEFLKSYPTVLGLKDTNAELAVLAILADAVGELEHSLARSKRVRIDLCLPEIDRTRYTSKGCAYLLRESFFNLLQNAIMFCSKQEQTDRRTVTVDYTFRHNKELVISITDRGRGMLKEEIKRLNEEAERAVPAAINDLGLISGIRIAMRVAHRMNGTLRYYRPESGEGIVVEFVLPAKELFYESE